MLHVISQWGADWPVPTEDGSLAAELKLVEKSIGCIE